MRLAIFGSRTLSDERVEELIQLKIDELKPECIITSGETSGVNEIARAKAKENKIRLVLEFANNKKYAAGKYEHRSIEILKQCEFAIFIDDGQSKGTLNELAIAKKIRKRYEYIKLDYHDEADLNWDELKFEWPVDKS